MKISDYSIYHWSFQFAVFCELNPIYKVVLSKVNGKKIIQKIRNAFTFTTENLIFSNEVSQHFRIKNFTMQIVSRYVLNGVTQESKKCNVFAFKCPWILSGVGAE